MFSELTLLIIKSIGPLGEYLVNPDCVKRSVPTLKEQSKIKYRKICEHCMRPQE